MGVSACDKDDEARADILGGQDVMLDGGGGDVTTPDGVSLDADLGGGPGVALGLYDFAIGGQEADNFPVDTGLSIGAGVWTVMAINEGTGVSEMLSLTVRTENLPAACELRISPDEFSPQEALGDASFTTELRLGQTFPLTLTCNSTQVILCDEPSATVDGCDVLNNDRSCGFVILESSDPNRTCVALPVNVTVFG